MKHPSNRQRAIWLAPIVLACQVAAANQLANGGFDVDLGPADGGGNGVLGPFVRFNAPSNGLKAWSLVAGSVEVFTDYLGTGNQVLNLTRTHTGSRVAALGVLEQSFATVAGQAYAASFLMGGTATPAIKELEVSILGTAGTRALHQQVFALDVSSLKQSGQLVPMQFSFVADGASAVIRFRSLDNTTDDGPYLDSVDISAVPEVSTGALLTLGLPVLWLWRRRSGGARRS